MCVSQWETVTKAVRHGSERCGWPAPAGGPEDARPALAEAMVKMLERRTTVWFVTPTFHPGLAASSL